MSDGTFPPDDEIVSAHLDGEATPADASRIEADPRLRRRRDELARARELVAQPVVPTTAQREAAIGAALAAFDEQRRAAGDGAARREGTIAAGTPADELAARRATPLAASATPADDGPDPGSVPRHASGAVAGGSSGRGRSGTLLAIAAAFVLVLLGVGAIVRATQRDSTTTTAASGALRTTVAPSDQAATGEKRGQVSSGATSSSGADASSSPAAGPASTVPATTSSTPAPAGGSPAVSTPAAPGAAQDPRSYSFQNQSLGTISSPAQLRAQVLASLQAQASGSAASPTAPSAATGPAAARALAAVVRCDATTRAADPELGPLVLSAPATYAGTDAVVLVYGIDRAAHPAANGASRIYAVDATTCAVLDTQTG